MGERARFLPETIRRQGLQRHPGSVACPAGGARERGKTMRILMTTDTVGGVWSFTKELATGLLKNGDAVSLVSFGRKPSQSQSAWAQEQRVDWGPEFGS